MSEAHVTGSFELHVFVAPLDPPLDAVERFRAACASAPSPMKPLLLQLDYVHRGFMGVLQSSRYVQGDVTSATAAAATDAAWLRAAGFEVIREKVEAVATDPGVPQTADDALGAPADRYFEFHLLVDGRNGPLSDADRTRLADVAVQTALRLGTLVPASDNALKPGPRFLNLRASGVGLDGAMENVRALRQAIEADGTLVVNKVIAEYVCADTNRAVDDGWLEPLPRPTTTEGSVG